MKPHEHSQDQELQRDIEEQEIAMSQMLLRVMERPLMPLHKTIEELAAQITAVKKDSVHAVQAVEAGLIDVLENQSKRLNRQFSDVMDDADKLKESLAGLALTLKKHHTEQAEGDVHMQHELARAGAMLAQQQSHVDDRFAKTTAVLDRLDTRAIATSDSLAAAAGAIGKLDTDLATLREQERGSARRLSDNLTTLTQRLDRQQALVCERIDAVQASMTPHFAVLASTIDDSSKEIAARYTTLSNTQKALVTAAIEEQLAIQLSPLRAKSALLFVVCAMSFASTLTLLGLHFYH